MVYTYVSRPTKITCQVKIFFLRNKLSPKRVNAACRGERLTYDPQGIALRSFNVTKIKPVYWIFVFAVVVLLLDVVRQSMSPGATPSATPFIASAGAQSACPVPPVEKMAGTWRVTAVECTTPACRATHFEVGDRMTLAQDISGAKNFSVAVAPAQAGGKRPHTEGYELRSDGIGNAVGPIVLDHNVLDGTPLQLHWMILKIHAYDADGFGSCKIRGLIAVCDQEPAQGSTVCSDRQHAGMIHIEP
jgi:hypothetical protein